MRIVHVVQTDAFAGVERYVALLAASQHAMGHHVVVIGGNQHDMREALGGLAVAQRPARTLIEAVRSLDEWRACDVIHTHMTAAETAALLTIRAWRVPVVSTRHFARRRGSSAASRSIRPLIAARVKKQIAISRYVADAIGGQSVVIRSGVHSADPCAPASARDRTVLVAQRLEREKATDLAILAFAASRLAAEGWLLEIAGDGAEREALGGLANDLGTSESVRFLGQRTDVPALMGRAGILLAPCPIEGLGMTVLEAMASGLPVVAAGSGGHLETLGVLPNAALFPSGDAGRAADQLLSLAHDAPARDVYGAALQRLQRERFTVEAQALATDAVYRSVL